MSFVRKTAFAVLGLSLFVGSASVADAANLRARRLLVNKKADTAIMGEYKEGRLGNKTTIVGDLDGDGYDDYIVSHENGVVGSDEDSSNAEFGLYIFYGDSTLPAELEEADADAIATYPALIGHADVIGVGDLDGDGYDDVVTLDHKYSGSSNTPYFHVLYGSSTRLSGSFAIEDETVNIGITGSPTDRSVAPAGDVNGDGYSDFFLQQFDRDGDNEGHIHLIYGSGTRMTDADDMYDYVGTSWVTTGDFLKYRFKTTTMAYGDLNGDGYDDAVLAYEVNASKNNSEKVLVYYGSATGLAEELDENNADYTILVKKNAVARSKASLADDPVETLVANGDLNGDGYDDLAISSLTRTDSHDNVIGTVGLLYGKSSQYSGNATFNSLPALVGSFYADFGGAVSYANVDGDSYDDLLVTANAGLSHRRVYLFKGKAAKYSGVSANSFRAENYFRLSLADLSLDLHVMQTGDINGDGYDDMIFGVPEAKANGKTNAGRAYIVLGQTSRYGKKVFEGDSYIDSVKNLKYGRVRVNYENGDSRRYKVFNGVKKRKTQVDTVVSNGYTTGYAVLRPNGKRVKLYSFNGALDGTFVARTSGSPVARILQMEAVGGNPIVVATLNGGTIEITANQAYTGYPQTDTATITGYAHSGFQLDERDDEFDITFLGSVVHTFSIDDNGLLTQIR